MVVAVSMSEPHAGTALTDLTTRARIDGDAIVLDGQKRWSSGGGHADAYVVYCRLSEAPGAAGIGAVLVEKDRAGLRFGKPEKLMGFRGIPSCDIFLDNRSEEHTSELQSLMRISYAVICLKKKTTTPNKQTTQPKRNTQPQDN